MIGEQGRNFNMRLFSVHPEAGGATQADSFDKGRVSFLAF
jgi:hypothetical protein